MLYYFAAFALLYYLRARDRGWKRFTVALVGGALAAWAAKEALGALLRAVGVFAGDAASVDSTVSTLVPPWLWFSVGYAAVDILAAVGAVFWLARGPRKVVPASVPPGVLGPAVVSIAPGAPPATIAVEAGDAVPTSTPAETPVALDATAAETFHVLLVGLGDAQPDVRRDCAALMAAKFLPALDHEPDPARRQMSAAVVRTLAADARPPRDDAETQALARAVALYTRLTAPPPA